MKNLIIILLFILLGCKYLEKEKQENQTEQSEPSPQKPSENWEVTKQYDEYGNLIKYDSIYLYSYSNIDGDTIQVNLDSIMFSFRNYFHKNIPSNWDEHFSYFPKSDSLFMSNFFKDNYFFNEWTRKPLDIEKMMRQMDSTRNSFLKKFHPGLIESKNDE